MMHNWTTCLALGEDFLLGGNLVKGCFGDLAGGRVAGLLRSRRMVLNFGIHQLRIELVTMVRSSPGGRVIVLWLSSG